jgi:hypothetical protein
MADNLLYKVGLLYNGSGPLPDAQTERRGGAGPVRGLLGGKDLTGRPLLILEDGLANRPVYRTVCKTVLHKRFNPCSFRHSITA